MAEDATPRITPHLLARGPELCPRRLALELEGRDGDAGAFTRWRIRVPFVEAAALAHRRRHDRGSPLATAADFPAPFDLEPEEADVWRRATNGYLARFGAVAATTIDHDCERATVSTRFGVRVGGAVDLLVRHGDGGVTGTDGDVELRQFELWGRPVDADPRRNWEIALAVLRLARLLSGRVLRIHHVDLLGGDADAVDFDYETGLAPLRDRFATRLDELRRRAATGEAIAGTGCGQCRHVAMCPAHREVVA